jgi:hypothetical protein
MKIPFEITVGNKINHTTNYTSIDIIATKLDNIGIDVQPELGFKNKYKLYVHLNGETVLRICKITKEQISIEGILPSMMKNLLENENEKRNQHRRDRS